MRNKRVMSISIDAQTLARIDKGRGLAKRSTYIEYLIKRGFSRAKTAHSGKCNE